MRTLHQPNYSNTRKYSAQDNAERIEAEREDELLYERWSREADEEKKVREQREPIIIKGLVQKYGFSQAGAERTMEVIKNSMLSEARFATPEMKEAALKALQYYCSK